MAAFPDREQESSSLPVPHSEQHVKVLSTLSTIGHLDTSDWKRLERIYDEITKAVHAALIRLLHNPHDGHLSEEVIIEIPCMGDDAYISQCRSILEKNKIVKKLDPKKLQKIISSTQPKKGGTKHKKPSKGITREEIKRQNTLAKAKETFEKFFETLSIKSKQPNFAYGFKQTFVELRLITFICIIHFYKENIKKIRQEDLFELIIAIHRVRRNINKFKDISTIICDDLKLAHEEIILLSKFTYEEMLISYPRLCLSTKYDGMFPSTIIKPHESQVALARAICPDGKITENIPSMLILLRAMIGSGKTTGAIILMEYIRRVVEIQKAKRKKTKAKKANVITKNLQLICACAITHVAEEFMRMAINAGIPVGHASIVDDRLEIRDNFNCHGSSDNRVVIVADVPASVKLLEKGGNYALFLDEPTVGADTPNNELTHLIMKIIALAPKLTVLSSATLPDEHEIPKIMEHFKQRHALEADCSDVQIKNILSKQALIGSRIIRPDGSTLVPFERCTTVSDLKFIIQKLEELTFVERLMTPKVTCTLKRIMERQGITELVDLEEYFGNFHLITQSDVHNVAIMLLKRLVETGDDRLVEIICGSFRNQQVGHIGSGKPLTDSSSDDSDDLVQFESDEKPSSSEQNPNPNNIFTTDAHKYQGCCLVVTTDPYGYAKTQSQELFAGQPDFATYCKIYDRAMDDYNRRMRKLDRSTTAVDDETRDQRAQRIQLQSDSVPVFPFPSHLRVGTIDHLMHFTPKSKHGLIDKRFLIVPIPLDSIHRDLSVPDEAIMMLCANISILSPDKPIPNSSHVGHHNFTKLCSEFTSNAQAAFTVSDESISYGVNCVFRCMKVEPGFEVGHSIQTIFQTFGRTGRLHKSWEADIHISNELAERLLDYIHGVHDNGIFDEAKNMLISFEKALIEIAHHEAELDAKRRQLTPSPSIDTTPPVATVLHNGTPVQVNTVGLNEIQSLPTPPRPEPVVSRPDHRASLDHRARPDYRPRSDPKPYSSGSSSSSSSSTSASTYVPPHLRRMPEGSKGSRRYADTGSPADDAGDWRTRGKPSSRPVSSGTGRSTSHSSSCPPNCDGRSH